MLNAWKRKINIIAVFFFSSTAGISPKINLHILHHAMGIPRLEPMIKTKLWKNPMRIWAFCKLWVNGKLISEMWKKKSEKKIPDLIKKSLITDHRSVYLPRHCEKKLFYFSQLGSDHLKHLRLCQHFCLNIFVVEGYGKWMWVDYK